MSLHDAIWERNDDGSATVTISAGPVRSNWIDTCGHRYALIIVGFLECDEPAPSIDCSVGQVTPPPTVLSQRAPVNASTA